MAEAISYKEMMPSEKEVAEYLTKLNIFWQYERPVFVFDEKGRPRIWTPDFYLPELGIYIEVCGDEKFDYNYRNKIYRSNGVFVVFLHWYKEKSKWKKYLGKRIQEIEKYWQTKVKEMTESILTEKRMEEREMQEGYCPYCGAWAGMEDGTVKMCGLCGKVW